jgi:hypothetical protein
MLAPMTIVADILPGPGLPHHLEFLVETVRLGVRRFWRGGMHANAPVTEQTMLLNRLMRVLRWVYLILAANLELAPARPRAKKFRRARWRPHRAPFPLFARYVIRYDDTPKRPVPAGLARAAKQPRDRIRTVERKLDALARALANPLPIIRRMARRLPTQLMVFGWRPPKRPPPTDKREYFEDITWIYREACHQLSLYRRRRRAIEQAASGS